jgi:membrane protease YdiL (CAAX protease family)
MDEMEQSGPSVWPVFVGFVVAMGGLMVGGVVVTLAFIALQGDVKLDAALQGAMRSPGYLFWVTVVSNLVFGATALVAVKVERRVVAPRLRWPRPAGVRWSVFVAALLMALGLSEGSDRVVALLGLDLGSTMKLLGAAVREGSTTVFIGLTLLLTLAGLTEELFFRGYIQTRLRWRWSPGVAVIVAAGLFGLAHFDPVHSTLTLFIGIVLGAVTEVAGTIKPAVVAHCANNLFAGYSARFLVHTWYGTAHIPMLVGAVVVLAVGSVWLWRAAPALPEQLAPPE